MKTAGIAAVCFLCVSVSYIWLSTWLGEYMDLPGSDWRHIELVKGIVFCLITSVILFVLIAVLLGRIVARDRALVTQREAILASERRAAAGLFALSVAHDINNVLQVFECLVEEIERPGKTGGDPGEYMRMMRDSVANLRGLSRRLQTAQGHKAEDGLSRLDLMALAQEITALAATHEKARKCHLDITGPDTLPTMGHGGFLRQMLLNLLLNAADAAGQGGEILVRVGAENDEAFLEVHDDGPGVPPDQVEKIFEPFHTTKENGSGLGLLAVRACAELHQGYVTVSRSQRLDGACFTVHLPREPIATSADKAWLR